MEVKSNISQSRKYNAFERLFNNELVYSCKNAEKLRVVRNLKQVFRRSTFSLCGFARKIIVRYKKRHRGVRTCSHWRRRPTGAAATPQPHVRQRKRFVKAPANAKPLRRALEHRDSKFLFHIPCQKDTSSLISGISILQTFTPLT